ncbi:MAG: glucosyl-3-phosphoglycerate synthase [Chloroflexota bacterium]
MTMAKARRPSSHTPTRGRSVFVSLRRVLVPVIHGCPATEVLRAARMLAPEVRMLGLVRAAPNEPLSGGASAARQVRETLRQLTDGEHVRPKARVRVSSTPWQEVLEVVRADEPDLLLLEWGCQLDALDVSIDEVLSRPPCDILLVRGPVPERPGRVLVPMRGGPHAELALRIGLSLRASEVTALHLVPPDGEAHDKPFRGLERVLARLPEVTTRREITSETAGTILDQANQCDLVVLGATARRPSSGPPLGSVAEQVLQRCPVGVLVAKTRRAMPEAAPGESVGAQAISILVDKWFAENTYQADEFADLDHLLALKQRRGVTISLALPALNEQATVGKVIRTIKAALMDRVPLLDEIVLIDSNSTDRTRQIAAGLKIPVYIHQELLPELGPRPGKGEALWKSLLVTRGDIIAWIDTDIVNIDPRFVYGILGPLLLDPRLQFVKGFYRRPLRVGDRLQAGGGGRVTELTARPLLNLFYPELSGMVQPLAGEYAGRRAALEQLPFYSGYGVETGLLIDILERYGLSAIAQVDLLERVHHNQPLEALSKMSFAIIQAVMHKLEARHGAPLLEEVNRSMKLIRYQAGAYFLEVEEIAEQDRPPIASLPQYQARQLHASPA